jgi:hypothetical protein
MSLHRFTIIQYTNTLNSSNFDIIVSVVALPLSLSVILSSFRVIIVW